MRFEDEFGISRRVEDDWFDPILNVDVGLFIDPFLIYWERTGHFAGAHQELYAFFKHVFVLVAKSRGLPASREWQKAVQLLCLKEPSEFCLGYTGGGTKGSGTGPRLAELTIKAIWKALDSGVPEFQHFEAVQLFGLGIGPDRISDDTARILLWRFIAYTEEVAVRHRLPTRTKTYPSAKFDFEAGRWSPVTAELPYNERTKEPILLTPARFLRELPTINPEDFLHYCFERYPGQIERFFGEDLLEHIDKKEIIAFALQHPDAVDSYTEGVNERPPEPYALGYDPAGLVSWYDAGKAAAQNDPVEPPANDNDDFKRFVLECVEKFRHFVEERGGWRLMWNDDYTPRREQTAQDVFLGVMLGYCEHAKVKLIHEADVGRGPVDFLLVGDRAASAHIELKLGKNGRGLNGITKQLPTYLNADRCDFGVFLVIAHKDTDIARAMEWERESKKLLEGVDFDIRFEIVDAQRDRLSASKL